MLRFINDNHNLRDNRDNCFGELQRSFVYRTYETAITKKKLPLFVHPRCNIIVSASRLEEFTLRAYLRDMLHLLRF